MCYKRLDVNFIQICLAKQIAILPHVYADYLEELDKMHKAQTVSLVPLTILQLYCFKLKKIA